MALGEDVQEFLSKIFPIFEESGYTIATHAGCEAYIIGYILTDPGPLRHEIIIEYSEKKIYHGIMAQDIHGITPLEKSCSGPPEGIERELERQVVELSLEAKQEEIPLSERIIQESRSGSIQMLRDYPYRITTKDLTKIPTVQPMLAGSAQKAQQLVEKIQTFATTHDLEYVSPDNYTRHEIFK